MPSKKKLWDKVREALDRYVHTYGYFDICIGDDEMTLYRGDYAFGEIGEISINE